MKKYSKIDIKQLIDEMTLDYKVGQLFLLAYPGKDPEVIRPLIEKYGICGCYISQDNGETFMEASDTSAALQKMGSATPQKIPLLLGVDQEGAWGVLLPQSHTGPGNLALGALKNQDLTRDMYEIYGKEMLSVGYNALLSPCADVNIDPKSPIIGTRSFGEYPDRVSISVEKAVSGAASSGILTTLKHFPGHGGTGGDSHREIPEVDKSLEDLFNEDLLPFQKGIDAGADMVMTAHIRFPQIDKDLPATMSPVILNDILRKKMKFDGVILSDSMNMGAIRKYYDPAESTLMALNAGVDVVMLSEEHYDHNTDYLPKQIASLEMVKDAILKGELPEEVVDKKLFRILDMKLNKMKLKSGPLSETERKNIIVKESEISKESISLLRKGFWPIPHAGDILCINATPKESYANMMNERGIGPNQKKPAYQAFQETLEILNKEIRFLSYEEAFSDTDNQCASADAILLVTEDYPLPGEDFAKERQQALVNKIAEQYGGKSIIIGLRSPYEISVYPKGVSYLCTFSSRLCSAREAAGIISGRQIDFSTSSPVSLPL